MGLKRDEFGKQSAWEGAQAGLCVHEPGAGYKGEDVAGEGIANAAAQWHIFDEAA